MTQAAEISSDWSALDQKLETFVKLMTTKAAIGQTPKELIWTLNKAKLYRYLPVVPPEERHRVPLLLIFALMNRPTILDLRPGHSFVEYMVARGYDVYLLDWGIPGPEDKNLRFDDYTLDYMPRAIRKMKAVSGSQEFSMLVVHRRDSRHDLCFIAAGRRTAQLVIADRSSRFLRQPEIDLCALDRREIFRCR